LLRLLRTHTNENRKPHIASYHQYRPLLSGLTVNRTYKVTSWENDYNQYLVQ